MSDWSWRSLASQSTNESPRDLRAFSNPQELGEGSLDFGVRRRRRISSTEREKDPLDIVQFSAPIFFLDEAEGTVSIDVMRLGELKGTVSVSYSTVNASARAGEKFLATEGVVVFLDGEYMKTVTVTSISDDMFAPTLEFKIKIYEANNCELGMYLHTCIVKIIDDDPFPSSKYKKDLDEGEEGSKRIPSLGLFWEYVKLNFASANVARSSVLVLCLDQIENAYNFFIIWAGMYLVDTLFQLHDPQSASHLLLPSRIETAVFIGVCYVAPLCVLHCWSLCKVYLDVEGNSRAFLQHVLLRKYLNFSEASRCKVTSSDLLVSVIDDASDLAAAYTSLLSLSKLCGKLLVLLYFVSQENPKALGVAMMMPVVMLVFAILRFHSIEQVSATVGEREVEMISLTDETCNRYRLVADYARRPKMSNKLLRRIQALQRAKLAEERVAVNNRHVPVWVSAIFIGSYVATSSSLVFSGTLTLGRFMATIGIFEKISGDFSELYKMVMQFSKVVEPLKGLTALLNLETDLQCWKHNRRHSRDVTATKLEKLYHGDASSALCVPAAPDLLEIELLEVSFEYQSSLSGAQQGFVLFNASISVPQGKLVAVVGDQRAGRSTFMRCLGRVIFPTSGHIFIPSHLRVLHVTQEPALMNLSLFENLTFGCLFPSASSDCQRVREILRGLQMPELLEMLDVELRRSWHQRAATQKQEVGTTGSMWRGASLRKVFQAQQLTASGYFSSALADSSDSDEDEGDESKSTAVMGRQETEVTVWVNETSDEGGDGSKGTGESCPEPPSNWQETITYTDKAKIHLARALIVNAEVMILQRPLYHYNHQRDAQDIIEVLQEHTRNRGYKFPQDTLVRRRPRSIFFTPEVVEQAAAADEIWHLDGKTHLLTSIADISTLSSDFALPALTAQDDMQPEQEPNDPQSKNDPKSEFRFVSF